MEDKYLIIKQSYVDKLEWLLDGACFIPAADSLYRAINDSNPRVFVSGLVLSLIFFEFFKFFKKRNRNKITNNEPTEK